MATIKQVKHAAQYPDSVFKGWPKAELGAMPTEAQLATAHVHGKPGKQSLAVAMALRDGGVTGAQIKLASSRFDGKATPQLNHMRALIDARMFTQLPGRGYCLEIGPNHEAFLQLHSAAAASKGVAVKAANKPTGTSVKSGKKAVRKAAAKAKAEATPEVASVVADGAEANAATQPTS